MDDDFIGLRNKLPALGGRDPWPSHWPQADFLKTNRAGPEPNCAGGVRVAELNANRLVRLAGISPAGAYFILAQVGFVHELGRVNHPFLDTRNLHFEQVLLAVEFAVPFGLLGFLFLDFLAEQKGMNLG